MQNNAKTHNRPTAKRSRRKLRPKNQGNNQMVNSSGGTASVQNRLRNNQGNLRNTQINLQKALDIPYVRCRLDPFNSGSSMGVPDSNAVNKLCFDHRAAQDFAVNGGASLLILPTLPFGAAIKPDSPTSGNITVGGVNIAQAAAADPHSWIPIAYYRDTIPSNNGLMNPTVNGTPIVSSRLRISGVGFRLICTSPAVNIGGVIEAVDSELGVDEKHPNPTNVQLFPPNGGSGANYPIGSVDIINVNMSVSERYQQVTSKTVQMRPEMMPQGVLHHTGPYVWTTIHEFPVIPTSAVQPNAAFFTDAADGSAFGSILHWDPNYSAKRIRINTPSNLTFRLETITCVEYILQPNSPFSRVSMPPTKVNQESVEIVDTAIARTPAIMTPRAATSFINKLLSTVGKFATPVGAAFGPHGSVIGASVSAISNSLAQVL